MEILINVEDYLSTEELKNVCEEELRNAIRKRYSGAALDGLIYNISSVGIEKTIDEVIPKYKEEIVKGIQHAIDSNYISHHVFRPKDMYETEDSLGWKYQCDAIKQRKQDIYNKINETIDNMDFKDFVMKQFGNEWVKCMNRFQDIADAMYYMVKNEE